MPVCLSVCLSIFLTVCILSLPHPSHPQLGPWLAVEIPDLLAKGMIHHKDDAAPASS
jgi:hypothetical protein